SLSLQPSPPTPALHSFPTRRSSDLTNFLTTFSIDSPYAKIDARSVQRELQRRKHRDSMAKRDYYDVLGVSKTAFGHGISMLSSRSEEHTSELQSPDHLVCRLLLEKK